VDCRRALGCSEDFYLISETSRCRRCSHCKTHCSVMFPNACLLGNKVGWGGIGYLVSLASFGENDIYSDPNTGTGPTGPKHALHAFPHLESRGWKKGQGPCRAFKGLLDFFSPAESVFIPKASPSATNSSISFAVH
jgi:hypothetical protein